MTSRRFHVQQLPRVFPDYFKCPNQAQSGGLRRLEQDCFMFREESLQASISSASSILKSSISGLILENTVNSL